MRLVSSHDSLGISDQLIESAVKTASSANAPSSHTPRSRAGVRGSRGSNERGARTARAPASIITT